MGLLSKIEWTNHTWNPWHGCKKVSPGCKYCYMYRDKDRYGEDPTTVLKSKTTFNLPFKLVAKASFPELVFTCSWSDFFIEAADAWRAEAWDIIKKTPELTYQILTKRPERIKDNLPDDWGEGYPNVWLGVSVESGNQKYRIRVLNEIPAKVRFLSAEPLLGPIFLPDYLARGLSWVIIGGESGNDTGDYKYRPMQMDWLINLIIDCKIQKVPVFVKQLGTYQAKQWELKDRHGRNPDEWPLREIKIREFPSSWHTQK